MMEILQRAHKRVRVDNEMKALETAQALADAMSDLDKARAEAAQKDALIAHLKASLA